MIDEKVLASFVTCTTCACSRLIYTSIEIATLCLTFPTLSYARYQTHFSVWRLAKVVETILETSPTAPKAYTIDTEFYKTCVTQVCVVIVTTDRIVAHYY